MEIAIISGKGGTGKSTISAAFATLKNKVVLADCDVDAANLHILFNPSHEDEYVFVSGQKAVIDYSLCSNCGLCLNYCRFEAIFVAQWKVTISEFSCDGCKLCSLICPDSAISMIENDKSRIYSGSFRNGKMVNGFSCPGEDNSGKLVNKVREKARELSILNNIDTIIIDGTPGIGCSAISSITGVNKVLIVTEPTISGIHDFLRILKITDNFNLTPWVLINKFDLNVEISDEIENYCRDNNIPFAGKLPFDSKIVDAMVNKQTIIEYCPESEISKLLSAVFDKIKSDFP